MQWLLLNHKCLHLGTLFRNVHPSAFFESHSLHHRWGLWLHIIYTSRTQLLFDSLLSQLGLQSNLIKPVHEIGKERKLFIKQDHTIVLRIKLFSLTYKNEVYRLTPFSSLCFDRWVQSFIITSASQFMRHSCSTNWDTPTHGTLT